MVAYYNEIDPYAAQWLRNLISAGLIAPGIVDERSIEDVFPSDLRGFAQCHFFAGIGVWSYALRAAGWSDDRPVWTGSCPCQPFSTAGARAGFDDERHLWPHWHWLIAERRPAVVFGEQVASKDTDSWVDLVHADMEGLGYAFGACPFPSAGIGAPHIRDRNYWMAYSHRWQCDGLAVVRRTQPNGQNARRAQGVRQPESCGNAVGLADSDCCTCREGRTHVRGRAVGSDAQPRPGSCRSGLPDRLGNASGQRCGETRELGPGSTERTADASSDSRGPGPVNGFWADADWLLCWDGKWRPVEPGTFPLVDGSAGRMGRVRTDQERLAAHVPRKDQGSRSGRLKGYGNAINAEAARIFIESVMEAA